METTESPVVSVRPPSNSKEQRERQYVDLVIAVDMSGSMALPFTGDKTSAWPGGSERDLSKREWLSNALPRVVSQLGDLDRLGLVCYNTEAELIQELEDVQTCSLSELQDGITNYEVNGGADLCSGVSRAVEMFEETGDSTRSRRLLFVSDSLPSASPEHSPFVRRLRELSDCGVEMTFFGLDSTPSPAFRSAIEELQWVNQQYIQTPRESFLV